MEIAGDRVQGLARVAARSAQVRVIEADLRRDLEVELVPFARDDVGLPDQAIRAEGSGRAGRFDALFGGVIIEFKRPGLLDIAGERSDAARQALSYLEDETLGARAVALTDGKTIGFLRAETAEPEMGEQIGLPFIGTKRAEIPPINRFSWRRFDEAAARALLSLIASQRAVNVTASNLIAYLGTGRAESLAALNELAAAVGPTERTDRTATLFEQWIRTAGVAYGIENASDPWPRRGRAYLLGDPLAQAFDKATYAEALFVLHTYMVIIAKCIAAEVLAIQNGDQNLRPTTWIYLDDKEFPDRFVALERGDVAEQLGAPGLLSTDLFDWYAHELSVRASLQASVRELLRQLGSLAWAEIAMAGAVRIDLLRQLYQSVVPARLRKAQGEFFTPRWLAQHVLGRALELYEETIENPSASPRLLDPSCGSGTFLVLWLGHLLDGLDLVGQGENPFAIKSALDRVLGIDINPVSAVMARVNLLLTLGDRARRLPEVSFNVFHADSIVLPRPQAQTKLGGGGDRTAISTAVGDFEVASWMLDRDRMAALRQGLEDAVRHDVDVDAYLATLKAEVGPIPPEEQTTVLDTCRELLEEMRVLHAQEKDDVWARVIEQALAPALLSDVDLVVGNPPWVSWKDLPEAWKDRSEPLWQSFGLWQRTQRTGGIPLSDISTLLLARSIATYAPNGLVAMLLPQSALLADPGGAAFRRSRLQPVEEDRGGPGAIDLQYRTVAVEDMAAVKPFAPDAQNLTVALFIRPGETAAWPVPIRSWRRSARARLPHELTWEVARERLEVTESTIEPVDHADVTSPWGLSPEGRSVALGPRRDDRPYSFGRGYETRGLDGLFVYRVLTPSPADGVIRVVNDPDVGDNTTGDEPRQGAAEATLFWPLVKGEDVERWKVHSTDRYAFVPYEFNDGKVEPVTIELMRRRYRRLHRYLLPWNDRFLGRSFYRGSVNQNFPWELSGPTDHLSPHGSLVFIRYLASGGRPAAAVAVEREDQRLGRTTLPYPNNKSNIYYTTSEDEAYFLAAYFNAAPVQAALARFAVSTGVTPSALERLPTPLFDPGQENHMRLAKLGREAHEHVGDPAHLAIVEAHIDELVWHLSGR